MDAKSADGLYLYYRIIQRCSEDMEVGKQDCRLRSCKTAKGDGDFYIDHAHM